MTTLNNDVLGALVGLFLLSIGGNGLLGYFARHIVRVKNGKPGDDGLGALLCLAGGLLVIIGVCAVLVNIGHGFYVGVTR